MAGESDHPAPTDDGRNDASAAVEIEIEIEIGIEAAAVYAGVSGRSAQGVSGDFDFETDSMLLGPTRVRRRGRLYPERSSKPQTAAKGRKFSQIVQPLRHTPTVFTGTSDR